MLPPLDADAPEKLIPAIDACKFLDVRHIIFNSALGVYTDEKSPLRIIERHLMDSGVGYTIVRPNFFSENFTTGFLTPMVARGRLSVAAGDGRTSFISTVDIAAVVTVAFTHGPHNRSHNRVQPLTMDNRPCSFSMVARKASSSPISLDILITAASPLSPNIAPISRFVALVCLFIR